MKNNRLFRFGLILIILVATLACGFTNTAKEVGGENTALYDKGVTMVRGCQIATADYYLVINGNTAKMNRAEKTVEGYAAAVNANTEAWTGNFRDQQAQLADLLKQYAGAVDPKTGQLDPTKINLDDLAKNGAMPNGLASGLSLYFNAVTQAPPPEVKVELYQDLLKIQTEAYDSMVYAGSKVNDKCGQYNTWRSTVTGEVLAKVSEMVGFPLPESLPLVTGGASQDIIQ